MRRLVVLAPIVLALSLTGCFTTHQLSPAEVLAVFDAARWGVEEAVALEYLTPADGRLFADVVATVEAAVAKNPSAAIAAGRAAVQEAAVRLPADARLRPYLNAAALLLK